MALQSPGHCSSIGSRNRAQAEAAARAWPAWLEATGIALAAALLRLAPWLAGYPLHRDEALYGYWARLIASGQDPLLLTPWVDKPPLSFYLIASSFAGLGVSELTLRVPGLIASILAVPMLYALAGRVYGRETARLAGGLFALSPFAVLFAPTAFTDPWLAFWLVLAAWAALSGRGLVAGLATGLAVASKQQGVLAVPLVIALLLVPTHLAPYKGRGLWRRILAALSGFILVFGPLLWWDSLRWHNRPSFWERSLTTYGPLAVAPPARWPTRAADWTAQLGYLFGFPLLSWTMLGLAAWAGLKGCWEIGFSAVRNRSNHRQARRHEAVAVGAARSHSGGSDFPSPGRIDLILAGYVAGYLALHLIVTFQPWDRYLLPLVPLLCLLAARGLQSAAAGDWLPGPPGTISEPVRRFAFSNHKPSSLLRVPLALALAAALGYAAWLGAAGRIPVGSDHGAYAGVRRVTAILRDQPAETVIYHQSLGWYFDFYLFDAPQERRWFDTAEKLADEAAQTAATRPTTTQWLVIPAWERGRLADWEPTLASRGISLTEAARVHRPDGSLSFAMYRIVAAGEKK
ncbi:MAG: ArnT family glycosyltransferase [Anaerolineae bacterium]